MNKVSRRLYYLILVVFVIAVYLSRDGLARKFYEWQKPELPEAAAVEFNDVLAGASKGQQERIVTDKKIEDGKLKIEETQYIIPREYNIAVPFASQAPFGD